MEVAAGAFAFRAPDGRRIHDGHAPHVLAHDPVLTLVEANLALGIGPRTCVPEWFGERPDYSWILDSLHRKDERARTAAPQVARVP